MKLIPHPRLFRAGVACLAVLLAASARAYDARFIDSLSPQEKAATGISKLTAAQAAALDYSVLRIDNWPCEFSPQHTSAYIAFHLALRHPGGARWSYTNTTWVSLRDVNVVFAPA